MGNTSSSLNLGYRILKLTPDSPCTSLGLECFLDFITEISTLRRETLLSPNPELHQFSKVISENFDNPLILKIYNIFSREYREVIVTPRRSIGIGLMLRQEDINLSETSILKVKGGVLRLNENEELCLGLTRFLYRNAEELEGYLKKGSIEKDEEMYVFHFQTRKGRFIKVGKGVLEGTTVEEGRIPIKEGSSCKSINIVFDNEDNQIKVFSDTVRDLEASTTAPAPVEEDKNRSSLLEETPKAENALNSQKTFKKMIPPENPNKTKKNKIKEFSMYSNSENTNSLNNTNFQEIEFIGIPRFANQKKLNLKNSIDKSQLLNENSGILSQSELNDSKRENNDEKIKKEKKEEKEGRNKFLKQYNFSCPKISRDYIISSDVLFDLEVNIQTLNI